MMVTAEFTNFLFISYGRICIPFSDELNAMYKFNKDFKIVVGLEICL